jgi:photosystem II stability/assembly factor-like uncharacterized protein
MERLVIPGLVLGREETRGLLSRIDNDFIRWRRLLDAKQDREERVDADSLIGRWIDPRRREPGRADNPIAGRGASWIGETPAIAQRIGASSMERMLTSIACSRDAERIAVCGTNLLRGSDDSGATWNDRAVAGTRDYASAAVSADGALIVAGAVDGYMYASEDGGLGGRSFESAGRGSWPSLALSAAGGLIVACGEAIIISTDRGSSWRSYEESKAWTSIAVSSDGKKPAACARTEKVQYHPKGEFHTSSDGGLAWTRRDGAGTGTGTMNCAGISADGSRSWVSREGSEIGHYEDGGRSWSIISWKEERGSFASIALSSDGSRIAGCVRGGDILTSVDGGATWKDRGSAGAKRTWRSIASSADGLFIAACAEDYEVIVSEDGGDTWTAQAALGKRKWTAVACGSGTDIYVARRPVGAAQVDSAAKALSFAVAADSGVRVRSKPDLAGAVAGRLVKVESMAAYWYRIRRLSGGLTGWAYGYYLKLED